MAENAATAAIEAMIENLLRNEMGLANENLDATTPLFSSNLLDSVSLVRLVISLEEKFQIRISSLEVSLERFDTIEAIAQCIERKQSK